MNKIFLALACAMLAVSTTFARQAPQNDGETLKGIVASYLEMHSLLATDKLEGVKGPARTLASQAQALRKDGASIARTAAALEQAPDLARARTAFGELSEAVLARLNAPDAVDARANVRLAYCPMVRKSWLQKEEQIRNPYYGTSMLTCGEFKAVK